MIVVSNTGPIIALSRISSLDLLQKVYGNIHIPTSVHQELAVGKDVLGKNGVDNHAWIYSETVSDLMTVELLRERLDAGESEAIVLAFEMNASLLLIDEARGRRVAESKGLAVTGTLGTLLLAKNRGVIDAVAPLLQSLDSAGFRMCENLRRTIIKLAGED